MKHLVEIKYEKSSKYPEIFINGEQISRYMALSDYVYDDIFVWVDRFFEIIDEELAEAYDVSVVGHPYHAAVLRSQKKISQYCENINFEPIAYRISIEEKYRYACALSERMHGNAAVKPQDVVFSCEEPEAFEAYGWKDVRFTTEASDLFIGKDKDAVCAKGAKIGVVLAEEDAVYVEKNSVLLCVTQENMPQLIDYLGTYHIRLDAINGIFEKLASHALDAAEKLEFEAYTAEEYRVLVKPIPAHMEYGDTHTVEYAFFPSCFDDPGVLVKTDNAAVVSADAQVLTAQDAGACTVSVYDASGKLLTSQKIEVVKHHYATNLSVILPATIMHIGETMNIRCIPTPNDAEDIDEIKYTVSDEKVAVMSGKEDLYALSSGRVCVTVSTPRISKKVYVSVLSPARGLIVSSEDIQVVRSNVVTVHCTAVPLDADPVPEIVWSFKRNGVINIRKSDRNSCTFVAGREGTTVLSCQIKGTEICKMIKVTVTKAKGCYVATAVYGSYDCPEVWALRRYRDEYLAKHVWGRAFIKGYYAVSPTAVSLFGKTKWFNRFFKKQLDRKVKKLQEKGYKETPYIDD